MKTQTTRDDLISIRGQIDNRITEMELSKAVDKTNKTALSSDEDTLALYRAMYAALDFLIRKTWGI